MKRSALVLCSLFMMMLFTVLFTDTASAQVFTTPGRVTMLRVNDLGDGFGPPHDFIDVEVVIALDSQPGKFFGFQLRNDARLPARQGMLDLLRDAFERNLLVTIDSNQPPGRNNYILLRAWLKK